MKSIIIFYDNHCPNCTRFAKVIKKTDWLNLVVAMELRNPNHTSAFENINLETAKGKMASFVHNKWYYGYNSIFLTLSKIPVFWIFVPLLYLLKITTLGEVLYNELAIKRKIIPVNCKQTNCPLSGEE